MLENSKEKFACRRGPIRRALARRRRDIQAKGE